MLTLAFILLSMNTLYGLCTTITDSQAIGRFAGLCAAILSFIGAYGVALVAFF